MDQNTLDLKNKAEEYRSLYVLGKCSRDDAIINIQPYLDCINKKSKELAKKYGRPYKEVFLSGFLR